MDISESLRIAKEIGTWLHGKTNNISVPSDKRTVIAISILQQTLDVADGMILST